MNNLSQIKDALDRDQLDLAEEMLKYSANEPNPEFLLLNGILYYKLQRWGEAANYFNRYLDFNPENTAALTYLRMIENILGFYHRDRFNP